MVGIVEIVHYPIDYCKERLSAYKVPKYVEFIDELPLTAIGKPDRKVLKQREMEKLKS